MTCFIFLEKIKRLESGTGNGRGFVMNLIAPSAFFMGGVLCNKMN